MLVIVSGSSVVATVPNSTRCNRGGNIGGPIGGGGGGMAKGSSIIVVKVVNVSVNVESIEESISIPGNSVVVGNGSPINGAVVS